MIYIITDFENKKSTLILHVILNLLCWALIMISIFEKNPTTKPTLRKGTICDGCCKTYPLEKYNLRRPSQNLPFGRVQFAMAVAKPTFRKGTICDGHCKTYPLEGYHLRWPSQNLLFRRVPFVTAIAKPTFRKGSICNSHRKTYPFEGYNPD
jgi:hypothetical protein